MKSNTILAASVAVAAPALATEYVSSSKLQELITIEDLLAGSQKLQDFADANGGNRAFGGGGHNATVDYLYDTLLATGYFDVVKQPFVATFAAGTATLSAAGTEYAAGVMTYSPSGFVDGVPLVPVANLGCAAEDFPAEVENAVAFISRGECTFGAKAINAKAAGATAAIVYNNVPGSLSGTLGAVSSDYAPVVGISQEDGDAIFLALEAGEVLVNLDIQSINENRTNYNVIAETKEGDKDNVLVLGGHSDSVFQGPGINGDGSGTISVLTVAKALSQFKVKNAVRFAFWGAEEFGKLGSFYYMKSLNTSEAEMAKMRAYLNFDIASPNYVYGIYDGDGNAFNLSGSAGFDVLEKDLEDFFAANGEASVPSEFSGRSDYRPFIENGIPSGGLFTGAEQVKSEAEVAMFGGDVGVAYDVHYHKAGDTIKNLALDAFLVNTKSIANSVAKYAMSFDLLPAVDPVQRRWSGDRARLFSRTVNSHSHAHIRPCELSILEA